MEGIGVRYIEDFIKAILSDHIAKEPSITIKLKIYEVLLLFNTCMILHLSSSSLCITLRPSLVSYFFKHGTYILMSVLPPNIKPA